MAKKTTIKKFVKDSISKEIGELWEQLDHTQREELTGEVVDLVYDEIQEVETYLSRARQIRETYRVFLLGILFGVVGGMVGNIIHELLWRYETIYVAVTLGIFSLLVFFYYIQNRNKYLRTFAKTPMLGALVRKAEEINANKGH